MTTDFEFNLNADEICKSLEKIALWLKEYQELQRLPASVRTVRNWKWEL